MSCRGIITVKNVNFLILFSLTTKRWHRIYFENRKTIQPQDITIRNNEQLLLLDKNNNLWSGDLSKIKFIRKLSPFVLFMSVSRLGSLLGEARGLITYAGSDGPGINDYLYYYMPRDGACVRWNFR